MIAKQQQLIQGVDLMIQNLTTLRGQIESGFSAVELTDMLKERVGSTPNGTEVHESKETKEKPAKAEKKANGNGGSKYVGQEIEYGGGRAKVIGKDDEGGFTARALTKLEVDGKERERGHEFSVSNTYVYRQLKDKDAA
jgi:hypothetical protein